MLTTVSKVLRRGVLVAGRTAAQLTSLTRHRNEFITACARDSESRTRARITYVSKFFTAPADAVSFLKRRDEKERDYEDIEPLLNISRAGDISPVKWSGSAVIRFLSQDIPGTTIISCDGFTVKGSHTFALRPPADVRTSIAFGPPGKILDSAQYGRIVLEEPNMIVERVQGGFKPLLPGKEQHVDFSAERLVLTVAHEEDRFHRHLYRGIRLDKWGASTERATFHDDGTYSHDLKSDAYDTHIFGRRARVRQVLDDKNDQRNQVIAVTFEGPDLDASQSNALWLALSFITGARAQPYAAEHFDDAGKSTRIEYFGATDYGTPATQPPFGFNWHTSTLNADTFPAICDGLQRVTNEQFPIAIALHHLFDANTSYYQVEMRNLLFCIHTVFEAWTDSNDKRNIINDREYANMRKKTSESVAEAFGNKSELHKAVQTAMRYAHRRTGATLQELFFSSIGRILDERDLRALRRRNPLFHSGYVKPKNNQSEHEFNQEMLDDVGYLRTLAYEAVLAIAGFHGEIYDYGRWKSRPVCERPEMPLG